MKLTLQYAAALFVGLTAMIHAQGVPYDPSGPAPAGSNTIVLWDFNGTVGTSPAPAPTDSANPTLDGANNGTISGGSSLQAGQAGFGTALSIGEARVATTFTPSLINSSQQITMAAWINPNAAANGSYVLGGAGAFLRWSGDQLNAGFYTQEYEWVEAFGGSAPSTFNGSWNHVAATFDKGAVGLWLNGLLIATNTNKFGGTINLSTDNWTGKFNLGGAGWDPDNYSYSGLIDDVRLMNTVIPEPSTYALLGLAGLAAVLWRRRRH